MASSESGLQHAINSFAAAHDIAGMKTSTFKTGILQILSIVLCKSANINEAKQVEKFKYLGVASMSDGRQDKDFNVQSGKSSAVMQALHKLLVLKQKLSKKTKLEMCVSPHSSPSSPTMISLGQ